MTNINVTEVDICTHCRQKVIVVTGTAHCTNNEAPKGLTTREAILTVATTILATTIVVSLVVMGLLL